MKRLLSTRYGTFDSEYRDSDQHSCNVLVKRLFGDVSGHVGACDEPQSETTLLTARVANGNHTDKRSNPD